MHNIDEELSYIKDLETNELIDIIANIWGFEETSKALLELYNREPQKALQLGIDILENDKGDDYLQATVWNVIFDISPREVIECLSNRTAVIGKVLLYEIFLELNSGYYIKDIKQLPTAFTHKIMNTYNLEYSLLDYTAFDLKGEFAEFMAKTTNT